MRCALLILVAACGGSQATSSVEPPFEPLQDIDQLELRADRACHCTDDGCRAAVRDTLHDLDDVTFAATERLRVARTALYRCLGVALGDAFSAVRVDLEDFVSRACSEDHAKEREVTRELPAWLQRTTTVTDVLLAADATFVDYVKAIESCLPLDRLSF